MAHKAPNVSETELEVLKVLWEVGSATVRQINDELRTRQRRWAYTTVLTLLRRLQAKGYVVSDKSELAHVFRPVVSRESLLRRRLSNLADDLCDGTTTPIVHALVENHRFSREEIERFRRLFNELETKPQETVKQPRRKLPPKGKT